MTGIWKEGQGVFSLHFPDDTDHDNREEVKGLRIMITHQDRMLWQKPRTNFERNNKS